MQPTCPGNRYTAISRLSRGLHSSWPSVGVAHAATGWTTSPGHLGATEHHDLGMQELSPRQPRGVHVTAPQQHLTHSSDAGRWCSLAPHFQGHWLASYITRSLPEAENGPEHALFLVRQQLKPQKPHGQGRLSQWGVQSSQNLGREEPQPGPQPRGSVPTALS